MVTKVETEEVCDECGSSNIGYDAWVKRIGGELEIVAGPYDRCICLNEHCDRHGNETRVRSVPIQNLRYCDGKDCYYQGDKDVMTDKYYDNEYWHCSRCAKEINSPEGTK